MTTPDSNKMGKISLDIELQDLLDIVSKSGGSNKLNESSFSHMIEGEDLRKAWFKHMLISIEKLHDLVENVRRVEIGGLRIEFKEELKDLQAKIEKNEDELKEYKKDIIDPMKTSVTTITVKLGMISAFVSVVSSIVTTFVIYIIEANFP